MKTKLTDLRFVYSNAYIHAKMSAKFSFGIAKNMKVAQPVGEKEVVYLLADTHPESARKALYLSPTDAARIIGIRIKTLCPFSYNSRNMFFRS